MPSKHQEAASFVRRQFFVGLRSFQDFEARTEQLANTKEVGDAFEILVEAYLHLNPVLKAKDVWLVGDVPSRISPSSAVQKTVTFYGRDVPDLGADFRHYIADFTGALGQAQPEVSEQLGGGGLGGRDDAQAQLGRDLGAAHRDDYVHAFDPGDLLD